MCLSPVPCSYLPAMNTLLLTFFHPPVPDNIAGRFGYVIAALRWILFRFPNWMPGEQNGLVSNRIGRLGNRFAALYARWQAGTLRPARPRATPRKPRPSASRPLDCLPRKAGWLGDLLSEAGRRDAWRLAAQVRTAVESDPEMQAFLAAAPQAGRLLRPLLRMLQKGPLPEALRLPKRAARPRSPCGRGSGEGEQRQDLACFSPAPNPPPQGGEGDHRSTSPRQRRGTIPRRRLDHRSAIAPGCPRGDRRPIPRQNEC